MNKKNITVHFPDHTHLLFFTGNISSHIQKPVSNFYLCQLFTLKDYMPSVQFAEVQNNSSMPIIAA